MIFIYVLMTMHPTLWDFTRSPCAQPHARPTMQITFLTALHRRIIQSSSQLSVWRRSSLRSSSVSDRNHTPSSGISLRFVSWRISHIAAMIHISQVCKLENVSHSCNHQQSLSARESFFIMPSLTWMYFEFFLGWSHQHSLLTREAFFTKLVW
jgi:hypothetical protein